MESSLVSDVHYLKNSKLRRYVHDVQSASVENDDFQVTVMMTQVECKEHKNYGKLVKFHLIICFLLIKNYITSALPWYVKQPNVQ